MFRTLNKHKQCLLRKTWLIGFFLCLLYIFILPTCSRPLPKVRILTEIDENPLEKYSQECREAHRRSNYRSALKICNDGLRLSKSAGERKYEGEFATYIGVVYDRLGHYEKALTYLEQSLAIARELGDRDEEGTDLNNIGSVYNNMGRYDKALIYLEQALAISREVGNRSGEGAVLGNIGAVYWGLGQYDKAFSYSEQALAVAREVDNRSNEGAFLGNIGAMYLYQGEYDKALSYFKKALVIDSNIVNRDRDASILGNIGAVYLSMDRYDKALLSFEQALSISREIGNRAKEGLYLTQIGVVYQKLGKKEKALTYHEQALVVSNEVEAPEIRWPVFYELMKCQKALDSPLSAIFYGKQSVNTLQSMRIQIGGLDRPLQQSFIKDKRIVYELLADLLVDEGRLAEAQQVLAMLKEEEYFDFIRRRSEKDPRGKYVSFTRQEKPWKLRYNKISTRLVAIAQEHTELLIKQKGPLTAEEEARMADLEQDLDVALKAFNEYLVELKKAFRETKRGQQREFPEE
jgi:tetratricopeptide (TPR) repeat protein